MGNEALIIGAVGILVLGVGIYAYIDYSNGNSGTTTSTTTSGTSGTLTSTTTGTTTTTTSGTTTSTTNYNPSITISPTNVSITSSGYNPSSLYITGNGFVPYSMVYIYDEAGDLLYNVQSSTGSFAFTLQLSEYKPQAGTGYIYATDGSLQSNKVSMTYTQTSSSSSTSPLGSYNNPYAPLIKGWQGAGYYRSYEQTTPVYEGTSSSFYSEYPTAPNPNKLPGTGYTSTNPSGSFSNPYLYSGGWQGVGYYQFTSSAYQILLNAPASGISVNPTYMSSQQFYNNLSYFLSGSSTSTGTISSSNATNSPTISISPNTISLTNGQTITITGTGFAPNYNGEVLGEGIQIAGFTANGDGNFTTTATYTVTDTAISGLWNAIQDASNKNFLDITAHQYNSGDNSNTVTLYF